jgi:hypothetical protein
MKRLTQRESQLNETIRSRNEWQQRAHSLEIINQEQRAEGRGVIEGKGGVKELAIEMLLTVYEYCHSIDKGLAYLRGRGMEWISKYVFFFLGFVVLVVLLYYHPEFITGFQEWLNNPLTLAVIGAVAIVAILIILRIRRPKLKG